MRLTMPGDALAGLWRDAGLPVAALGHVRLTGAEPVLPSSFAVGTAVQSSLAAAALAAAEIWHRRSALPRQSVSVDMTHAALDSCAHFSIDGKAPVMWDKLSGLYPCGADAGPGWVRIHANFAHHRDIALGLLGLPLGPGTEREAVTQALRGWRAEAFESAAAKAGAVVAALRSFDEWDRHAQALALAGAPLVGIEKIEACRGAGFGAEVGHNFDTHLGANVDAERRAWPRLSDAAPPLHGLRVLDLTRILAGPVAARTLAAYGADVMLVNSPHLPNIDAIADTSRGKLSAHLDLRSAEGRQRLQSLLGDTHVFLQGYRPGALAALGFGPAEVAALRPGIVYVSLSAYGAAGPWAGRRGFDSLVQTATGFNRAEADAAGEARPKAMPLQVLDYTAGYLLAFGAQAALLRQATEGGSWHVQVSLAGVGRWLRSLGRVSDGFAALLPPFDTYLETSDSGFGRLTAMRHAAQFSQTPVRWRRPSMPPGSHPPVWPVG